MDARAKEKAQKKADGNLPRFSVSRLSHTSHRQPLQLGRGRLPALDRAWTWRKSVDLSQSGRMPSCATSGGQLPDHLRQSTRTQAQGLHGTRGCWFSCDVPAVRSVATPTMQQERRPADPGAPRPKIAGTCQTKLSFSRGWAMRAYPTGTEQAETPLQGRTSPPGSKAGAEQDV